MLPGTTINIKDGGLGLLSSGGDGIHAKVGTCSDGENEQIYIFTDPSDAEETLGQGTLVEMILDSFASGSTKVLAVKADPSGGDAADAGTPAADSSNTSTGTVTTSGTPKNDRDFVIKIDDGGADGSIAGGGVRVMISKNGGKTFGPSTALLPSSPQTLSLGNGSSVVLTDNATPAGSFVEGDFWEWSSSEAKATNEKILDAVEVAAESNEIEFIHVCGSNDSTFWASISAFNAELQLKQKYIFFLLEAAKPTGGQSTDAWVTASVTASVSYFDSDVCISLAYALMADRNGQTFVRNMAGDAAGLSSKAKVNESIGWVEGMPLENVSQLFPYDLKDGHIDTLQEQGRYLTARFWAGHGFRMTNGRAMATITSNYQYLENLRPLYKAVRLVNRVVIPKTNSIANEAGLIDLQKRAEGPLMQMVSDEECEGYEVNIPSGQNIKSTGKVKVKVGVENSAIMRTIDLTFGLTNNQAA